MGRSKRSRRIQQAPKYHGLVNQGGTSYLNSVLQVLFMTKDFRDAVERNTDDNPDTIDRHLSSLFSDLQKYPAYTYNITRALGIDRVNEQSDAAEYIEKILRKTSKDASQIFHGLLSRRTTCCKCGTETDRDEAFWHLPLALVDSCSDAYSVVDGIRDFFITSDYSGENQMYCNSCDDKADATAQYIMKHHPDVLILLLKRFEFSYHHMSYVKINHVVDVPSTIEIPESQTYKLYAVVDHSGDLRGGHYTATIKNEDEDRWYHFNDGSVTLYDSQLFQKDNTEKSCTAQLLFYRKEEAGYEDNMSNNKCEDVENTRQRGEGEIDVEMGTAVSVGENEVTGNENRVRDVSRGVGQSDEPENEGNIRQTLPSFSRQDNFRSVLRQTESIKNETAGSDTDKETKLNAISEVEIKQTESMNETSDTDKETNLNANFKPEVSDRHETRVYLNLQDETNDALSRVADRDEKTEDEESENPPKDYNNRDAEHLSESESDKQNRNEDQGSNLKTRQQFDLDSQRCDGRPNISKNSSAEFLGVEDKDNVKKEEEGFGQKIVTKLAKEEEETGDSVQFHNREDSVRTVRGERENQEKRSEQGLNSNFKLDDSVQPEICVHVTQHDETNDAQSRVIDRDDKQPQKPPMDNFNKDAEYLSEGRLEKQNRNEDQDSNLMTRQQFDSGHMDKQEGEEIKNDIEGITERETGANAYPLVNVKSLRKDDPDYKQGSSSKLDNKPEQQRKVRRDIIAKNEQERRELDKKYVRNINPDSGSLQDARPNMSKNPSVELDCEVEDNQECKRDFSEPLGRHVEDKRGENIDSKRDGGHDQRRGSARKGSEGGTGKDRRRLDEGIRQKNVKEQAEEKEEKGEAAWFHNREDQFSAAMQRGEGKKKPRGKKRKNRKT